MENDKSELIGSVKNRNLNKEEREILHKNFNINLSHKNKFISDRVKIEGKIFHSKLYSRNGVCNSFFVNFTKKNRINYCDIEYFFKFENKLYAFIT